MTNKILIVDDFSANLMIMEEILSVINYTIITAENGKEAYELALEHNPDIILMDWQMPVMDGLVSLKHLKKNPKTAEIPVIMVTGNLLESTSLEEAFNAGAVDFIRKPFEKIELIARVKSILNFVKYFKLTIHRKNQELSASMLQQSRLAELYSQINKKLFKLKEQYPETEEIVNDITGNISVQLIEEGWKRFEEYFSDTHSSFYNNISQTHKNLTPSEIRLCTLLRLNMNSKEIAAFVHQEEASVRVSRSRLRKKIGLSEEESLTNYLMRF